MKKGLILGFQARLPIGIVLGFLGFRHEVLPLLQKINHSTRAFLWNANGLQGFVRDMDAIPILSRAVKTDELKKVTKWQAIDIDAVYK